jgi:hypothetical protein
LRKPDAPSGFRRYETGRVGLYTSEFRKAWESRETGVGSDVMKPIAAPIVGGMITSTIHVLILVPVFFALMKERALRRGTLQPQSDDTAKD